jgi:hypothetical protein
MNTTLKILGIIALLAYLADKAVALFFAAAMMGFV